MRIPTLSISLVAVCWLAQFAGSSDEPRDSASAPDGWRTAAPRDEIRPRFEFDAKGGRDGKGSFVIAHDKREGLHGYWTKTFPVEGGRHYRFQAMRRVENVTVSRRSAVARVIWLDDKGQKVPHDEPAVAGYLKGWTPTAEPEYPADKEMIEPDPPLPLPQSPRDGGEGLG